MWKYQELRSTKGHQRGTLLLSGITKIDQGALRVHAQLLEGVEEQGDMGNLLASQLIGVGLHRCAQGSLLAA